jgi:uracil-DNA glycosylase family 4
MEVKTRELVVIQREIESCRMCSRLVEWRELIAREKVRRFADQEYWGKAVPSFGDPQARLLVLGLAPAAHGANRTGRMFTGDSSGEWLYRALHRAGFANQPSSHNRGDGLVLKDCYISAVIHCAPPGNKPQPEEIKNCRGYLVREVKSLTELKVVVALGRVAFDTAIAVISQAVISQAVISQAVISQAVISQAVTSQAAFDESRAKPKAKRPAFAHGAAYELEGGLALIASYHPSQQNTFTGKLTEPMLDSVFSLARSRLKTHNNARSQRARK